MRAALILIPVVLTAAAILVAILELLVKPKTQEQQ
jgi:hypothetical protein